MVVGPYAKTLGGITVTQLTANDFVLLHWKIEDQTSPYHSLSFAEIEKQSGHPKQNDAIADGSLTKGQPLQLFSDKIKGNKKKKRPNLSFSRPNRCALFSVPYSSLSIHHIHNKSILVRFWKKKKKKNFVFAYNKQTPVRFYFSLLFGPFDLYFRYVKSIFVYVYVYVKAYCNKLLFV